MEKKIKYSYRSDKEIRQKNNPYTPFNSFQEYENWLLIWTVELNEIASEVPPLLIREIWIHDVKFRKLFRTVATMAAYIHREDMIQKILPWCYISIKKYAQRFEGVTGDELLKMMIK